MKKKEIKKNKIKPRTKAEIAENQSGVILERMEHKFDLLSEGFLCLDKKINNNHKEFMEFREEMADFKNETSDNFKTLFNFRNETNSNFKTSFEYLSRIDDRIQAVEMELVDLKNTLKDKASLDRVIRAEKEIIIIKRELVLCRRQ